MNKRHDLVYWFHDYSVVFFDTLQIHDYKIRCKHQSYVICSNNSLHLANQIYEHAHISVAFEMAEGKFFFGRSWSDLAPLKWIHIIYNQNDFNYPINLLQIHFNLDSWCGLMNLALLNSNLLIGTIQPRFWHAQQAFILLNEIVDNLRLTWILQRIDV